MLRISCYDICNWEKRKIINYRIYKHLMSDEGLFIDRSPWISENAIAFEV